MLESCRTAAMAILGVGAVALTAGCQLGPTAMRVSHAEYNEAIQQAGAEQLLLNLVRLKYREAPMVLDVGSISAQFEFAQSFGISGTLNENVGQALAGSSGQVGIGSNGPTATLGSSRNRLRGRNPDQLGLSYGLGFSERPTVTYTPLQGEEYADRMLTPISLSTLVKLVNSGWRADRVLILTVQEINGLDNVGAASGPTPILAPEFEAFHRVLALLRTLQIQRAVAMEYDATTVEISAPMPADKLTSDSLIQAAAAQVRFRLSEDGREAVLVKNAERPVLQLIEHDDNKEQISELRQLLKLAPGQLRFPLVEAHSSAAAAARGANGYTALVLDTRSLMGVMFYLSQAVESPEEHVRDGLVTQTVTRAGEPFDWSRAVGPALAIHASRVPPKSSALSIRKGGYWFYICDDDLNSKSTFLLLGQLFSLRAGAAKGPSPLLTLPVGG